MTDASLSILASPRPITDRARRRAWNEPSVRTWWLLAIAMAAVAAWLLIEQILVARTTRYRMAHWTRIDAATVEMIGDSSRPSYRVTPDQLVALPAKLRYFDLAAATTRELHGTLEAQRQALSPGNKIPILVDPADPRRWTDRVSPPPLFEEFFAPLLLMPLPLVLAGVAIWQRRRVLKVWQDGEVRHGTVMERRHSAVAPRSAILRCAVEDSKDRRLLSVAVPRSAHAFQAGDRIALVTPAGAGWAIAAMLYE